MSSVELRVVECSVFLLHSGVQIKATVCPGLSGNLFCAEVKGAGGWMDWLID